jgi:hypothetical protein
VLGNPAFDYLDGPQPRVADGAPDSIAPDRRTAEPWVDAGPWRCSKDLQGAPSVVFGDGT